MITNSKIFRRFRDCKSSIFDSQVVIPNPKLRSNSSMFRIFYMPVNKIGVVRFIFKNRIKFELFIYIY